MKDIHPDIIELLTLRATEGLSNEQENELQRLLEAYGLEDTLELDLAAAAASNAFALTGAKDSEEAPEHLKQQLRDGAARYFDHEASNVVQLRPARQRTGRGQWTWGWATAAALAIALLITNVVEFTSSTTDVGTARQRLLADEAGTRVYRWSLPEDPDYVQVTGDVVWNDEKQEGYMLLTGMPVNDPARSQYQLWLVDPDRDSNPVDGGVFDVPAGQSTVIVPIDAKLVVSEPTLFAITREQPGGVVVSDGPLLVVASAG